MNEARPDALLKSALEKIVYFEARSEHLHNDLASVRAEAERLKQELASAAQREIVLRRQQAELEVTVTRAHREKQELGARIEALLEERTTVLSKLIDGAQIHEAGESGEAATVDLASFISELRGEVLTARAQAKANASPALQSVAAPAFAVVAARAQTPLEQALSPTTAQAMRLHREGRLGVSEDQLMALASHNQASMGRREQTLFGFSVRELSAPDPTARRRAAERLKALGDGAAAPALAAALHEERNPLVQVALLQSFASLAHSEGAPVAATLLTSPVADVRIAALKAVLHLAPESAAPHLAMAVRDPDPSVRRRASLLGLSLRGEDAHRLTQETTHDLDPEVRRLTALALGANGGPQARSHLSDFLADPDVRVRRAAAQSLGRLLGRDVSHLVDMNEAQRRREVRRLAALPSREVRLEEVLTHAPVKARAVTEPGTEPPPLPSITPMEDLCSTLAAEIRCAIRGRMPTDLALVSGASEAEVVTACELLVARGQILRRGLKYFTV